MAKRDMMRQLERSNAQRAQAQNSKRALLDRSKVEDAISKMPGAESMTPADRDFMERVALAAQATLSSEKHSENLLQMASADPDGFAKAVLSIFALVEQQRPVPAEDGPVAAFIIATVLLDFLSQTGAIDVGTKVAADAMAATMDHIAQRYGATDADIQDLEQLMPGLPQMIMARRSGDAYAQGEGAPAPAGPPSAPQAPQGMMPRARGIVPPQA